MLLFLESFLHSWEREQNHEGSRLLEISDLRIDIDCASSIRGPCAGRAASSRRSRGVSWREKETITINSCRCSERGSLTLFKDKGDILSIISYVSIDSTVMHFTLVRADSHGVGVAVCYVSLLLPSVSILLAVLHFLQPCAGYTVHDMFSCVWAVFLDHRWSTRSRSLKTDRTESTEPRATSLRYFTLSYILRALTCTEARMQQLQQMNHLRVDTKQRDSLLHQSMTVLL